MAVFTLPFFLIRKLHIPKRQRLGLVAIFSLGAIAILMSIARIVALALSATTSQVAVWTALESAMAIIVSCCPALRPLLRRTGNTTTASSNPVDYLPRSKVDSVKDSGSDDGVVKNTFEDGNDEAGDILLAPPSRFTIMKNVEFEIHSERGSQVGPSRRHMEVWESRAMEAILNDDP
jgi:hypothetical protein